MAAVKRPRDSEGASCYFPIIPANQNPSLEQALPGIASRGPRKEGWLSRPAAAAPEEKVADNSLREEDLFR